MFTLFIIYLFIKFLDQRYAAVFEKFQGNVLDTSKGALSYLLFQHITKLQEANYLLNISYWKLHTYP